MKGTVDKLGHYEDLLKGITTHWIQYLLHLEVQL